MTSGSCWTHLIVTSGALVQPLEERVALPSVTGEAAVPLVRRNGGVERFGGLGQLAGREDGRQHSPDPLAKVHEVVHRDSPSSIRGNREFRVVMGGPDVALFDAHADTLDEKGGIA